MTRPFLVVMVSAALLSVLPFSPPSFGSGARKADPDLKKMRELKKYGVDLTKPQPVTFLMFGPNHIQEEAISRLKQAGFETETSPIDWLSINSNATKAMLPDLVALRQVRRDLKALLASLLKKGERGGYFAWDVPHEEPPFKGDVKASGFWVQGDMFLLFADIYGELCSNEQVLGVSYPQLFISNDRGRTWKRRGPPMNGNQFTLLSEKDGKIWVAGYHTAEANMDPFLFLPAESGDNWRLHVFYQESAAVDRMGWTSNGDLIAWIEHIDPAVLDHGPQYVHISNDAGRTWKILGLARKHPVAVELEFKKITRQMNPLWRALNFEEPGGVVQNRESETAPWKTVAPFPRPPACHR